MNHELLCCADQQASPSMTFGPLRCKHRHLIDTGCGTQFIRASHQKPQTSTCHLLAVSWRSKSSKSAMLTKPSAAPSWPRSEHLNFRKGLPYQRAKMQQKAAASSSCAEQTYSQAPRKSIPCEKKHFFCSRAATSVFSSTRLHFCSTAINPP